MFKYHVEVPEDTTGYIYIMICTYGIIYSETTDILFSNIHKMEYGDSYILIISICFHMFPPSSDISQVYTVSSLVEQTTPTSQVLVDVDASVSGNLEMLLESFGHLEENLGWDIIEI